MRRVAVPDFPIKLRPADAAVYWAAQGYPPRSIKKIMGGAISVASIRQAICAARARGENLPSFLSVRDVPGCLAKINLKAAS
jgi:hypothetical protein